MLQSSFTWNDYSVGEVCQFVCKNQGPIYYIVTSALHVVMNHFEIVIYDPFVFARWHIAWVRWISISHDNFCDLVSIDCWCFKVDLTIHQFQTSNKFIMFCIDQGHELSGLSIELYNYLILHFRAFWICLVVLIKYVLPFSLIPRSLTLPSWCSSSCCYIQY
jgi:hypothetical protein